MKHGLTQNGRTQARVAATALIEVVRKGVEGGRAASGSVENGFDTEEF